ncbi:hypothetical protein BH23CHL8_BH23CHL8_21350 [soil metagenome]
MALTGRIGDARSADSRGAAVSRASIIPDAFLVVSALFVACVVLQLFLAGLGVFESAGAFLTHRDFGYAFGWLALLMLILFIVGRLPRRQLVMVLGIIVAFAFQSVFIALRTDAPVIAALHPLNGVLILLLGLEVTRNAWAASQRPSRATDRTSHAAADRVIADELP